MKKKHIICMLLIVVLLVCAGCDAATHTGFLLYKSSPLGFRIEYPDSWSKEVNLDKNSAAFFTPQEGFGDAYRENLAITYEQLGESSFEQLFAQYHTSLPSVFPGYTQQEKSEVLIDQQPAYKLLFTSEAKNDEESIALKILQYIVCNEDRVYFITYSADPGNFDYFEPFVNTMLETFTFNV